MNKWVDRFNGVLLAAMFLITFYQILARDIFIISSMWTEELARFLFVWIVFIGAATLCKDNENITIFIVIDRMPPIPRLIISTISYLMMIGFGVIFIWSSYKNVLNNWEFYAPSMDWMRLSYLYLGLMLSGILMVWYLAVNLVKGLLPQKFKSATANED